MTYLDWSIPVQKLRAAAGPATEKQRWIAETLGCPHRNEPRHVLSAVIEAWLSPVLHDTIPPLATEKQLILLEELTGERPDTSTLRPVASAWISHYLSLRTAEALEKLKLKAGDRVHREHIFVDPLTGKETDLGGPEIISSIGSNGLVYFKGGNGKCSWPTRLRHMSDPNSFTTSENRPLS